MGRRHPVRYRRVAFGGRSAVARMLVAVVIVASGVSVSSGRAVAAEAVTGAGSTFAKIAIDQWIRDVSSRGLQLNFQGTGSSQGRNLFKGNAVDWASSDIPFESDEQPVGRAFTYLPLVAGGTAVMYNLVDTAGRRIDTLKLSGRTIAKIFTGQIRNWRAQEILDDNPQIAARIPDQDIKAVVRSGGSGTSAVFTGYMSAIAPDVWAEFASRFGIPGNFTSTFPDVPGFIKQPGSSEIATFVANPNAGRGSIGYAEAGYAHQSRIPVAYVNNQAGKWTLPTARNVAVALLEAKRNPDGTQDLSGVYFNPRDETYAISSYNYMIAPLDIGPGKGETLVRFITYSVTDGQGKAAPLGYSPLPPNLCDQALQEALRIPAPASAHDEARSWLGRCGDHYLRLDVQKPIAVPDDPQAARGGSGLNESGGSTKQQGGGSNGSSASRTTEPGASDATAQGTDQELLDEATVEDDPLLSGLTTRLDVDASGRAILSEAAQRALLKGERSTVFLLLIGFVILSAFFGPAIVSQLIGRQRSKVRA